MTVITIDGNIGAGKTSVLNYLHRNHKIPVDLEPVENWTTYLTEMYDRQENVFKFQIRVWLDRCWIQEKCAKTTILMERSPRFIQGVFINMAEEQKNITPREKELLMDLHKKTDKLWENNIYIYLRANPENCRKRIKKRNRSCEKQITDEYINLLHDKHENLYEEMKANNENITCIDIDNKTISEIANEILAVIDNI